MDWDRRRNHVHIQPAEGVAASNAGYDWYSTQERRRKRLFEIPGELDKEGFNNISWNRAQQAGQFVVVFSLIVCINTRRFSTTKRK